MKRRQIFAKAKQINVSAMVIVALCALAPAALALSDQTESPALKTSVSRIKQRLDVFPGKGTGKKRCIPQTEKAFAGPTHSVTIKDASCKCNASRSGRRFAQVEIVLSDRCSLERISSFSQATGSELVVLEKPERVRIELPGKDVQTLQNEGVQITILKKFFLAEGSTQKGVVTSRVSQTKATCPDSYREGSNNTDYDIPDNGYPDQWAYSEITITGAPGNHIVHCVDVHYEIIHPYVGDLYVDVTDDDLDHAYALWTFEGGSSDNINETETEITDFYGEPVNQIWVLWAADSAPPDVGHIDSWWIKVYHGPPVPPPPNDDCASAISVTEGVPYYGTTISATGSMESSCSYNDTLDVWNSFTPTSSGLYTISTIGSSLYDTTLSVFDGCSGNELSCNDDSFCEENEDYYYQSELTMNMSAGNTYLIRVAGFNESQGDYTLSVIKSDCSLPPAADNPDPPNDACDVETDTLLSWNEGPGSGSKGGKTTANTKGFRDAKLIYGSDDRRDEYEITDPCLLSVGDSTVALVPQTDLTDNGNGTYTLPSDTFAEWYEWIDPIGTGNPLCSDEPFRNQPAPAYGSGFLIDDDIIITAGHLACDDDCSSWAIIFGFIMTDPDTAVLTVDASEVYYCNEVLGRSDGYPDWAIIRLDRPVTGHEPIPFRTSGQIPDNEPVIVVGHPFGLPRKYDAGATVRDNSGVTYFRANADTYMGNSGSVVINTDTLEVEGILFSGNVDFVEDGSCDRSNVCPDSGCPVWEGVTRITALNGMIPWERYDVYFGTDNPPTQLICSDLTTPTCDPCAPGSLLYNTTYYWQVVTKSICGQSSSNPIWHFTTLEPNCVVPEVVGMPEEEAEAAIIGAGLTVGNKVYTCDDAVPAGYVINQNPTAGYSATPGSEVNLWVSLGRPLPDLNDDGRIDFADLLILAYYWMDDTCSEPNWCEGADCDCSRMVDYFDFANFAKYWLKDPNLIGHWTMDDDAEDTTVLDSSSNGNDGSAQQNTSILHTAGQIDGALKSLFSIDSHHGPITRAYSIEGTTLAGPVTISEELYGAGPTGVAVSEELGLMFMCYESDDTVTVFRCRTLLKVTDVKTNVSNLAGIVA